MESSRRCPVPPEIVASDGWWMMGITLLLFPLMYTGSRVNRYEGLLLITVYCVYLAILLTWNR